MLEKLSKRWRCASISNERCQDSGNATAEPARTGASRAHERERRDLRFFVLRLEGRFYPRWLPARDWFHYYASKFSAVEINLTFYRTPAESTFRKWQASVPPGFGFVLKASQEITHRLRLVGLRPRARTDARRLRPARIAARLHPLPAPSEPASRRRPAGGVRELRGREARAVAPPSAPGGRVPACVVESGGRLHARLAELGCRR